MTSSLVGLCLLLSVTLAAAKLKDGAKTCRVTEDGKLTTPTKTDYQLPTGTNFMARTTNYVDPCGVDIQVRIDGTGNVSMAEIRVGQSSTNVNVPFRRYAFDPFRDEGVYWAGFGSPGPMQPIPSLTWVDKDDAYKLKIEENGSNGGWRMRVSCDSELLVDLRYRFDSQKYVRMAFSNPADWTGDCF